MPYDDRTWETDTERKVKDGTKKVAKESGKKIAKESAKAAAKAAKKVAKKAAKAAAKAAKKAAELAAKAGQALGELIASTMPWSAIVIAVILVVIIAIVSWYAYMDKIKQTVEDIKNGVIGFVSDVFDLDEFDEEKRNAWNSGGDPDYTYILFEKLKANKEGKQEGEEEEDSLTENINDLMREDTIFFSPNDLLDVLESSYQYNNNMFKISNHHYQYQQWTLDPKYATDEYGNDIGEPLYYRWKEHIEEDNCTDDEVYGTLTNLNTRGESADGERIYTVHWQDICALMYLWGQGKYDDENTGWGKSEESEYVYNEGSEYEINSTNGYYFTNEEIATLCSIFEYKFNYYYDTIEDDGHEVAAFPYLWEKLKDGNCDIGYRYNRIAEPSDLEATYSSPDDYDGDNPTYTKFHMDSAPNFAANAIEQHKYAYISTSEVKDYTPDPDKYEPPEGIYCVGKWRIIDPRPFVNAMSDMDPWYKEKSYDQAYVEQNAYNWVDEIMDVYLSYLEMLDMALGTNRCAYYEHIRDLYNEEKIEVTYYGMKMSDDAMKEFVDKLKEANPGMNIEIKYDEGCHEYGDFYDISTEDPKDQAEQGTIPFPSYGVTYVKGEYDNAVSEDWINSGNIPGEYNYTGTVFISQHGSVRVNDWIYLVEGADEALDGGHYYTKEQIRAMLHYMNSWSKIDTSRYDFTKCTEDCYQYNLKTGADIAGFLAIIMTEYSPKIAVPTYNWFNITAYGSESGFKTSAGSKYTWWNAKAEFSGKYANMGYSTLEGCCMVKCMDKIYTNYWTSPKRKQNTYYRMTFNQYGWDLDGNVFFPQSWDEAIVQENRMEKAGHCYCPWWDDTGYLTTKFNPANLWCNKCAQCRAKLIYVAKR